MPGHEYTIVGHSRSKIGMYLAFLSGAISGAIALAASALISKLGAHFSGLPSLIMWPVTGGVVFGLLFLLFDKYFWRWKYVSKAISLPDISGTWDVFGKSFEPDNTPKTEWRGRVEITQQYERISVFLRTSQSSSDSVSAALVDEGRAGYRLIYSYRNRPKPGESDMKAHLGHCEILFSPDSATAEGQYFNGAGRVTHGTLTLKRISK